MSDDDDAPYKHTRLSDLKRHPLRDMASRPIDEELSASFNSNSDMHNTSTESSPLLYPKLSPGRSPGSKKKIYPKLNISFDTSDTDDARQDISDDESLNDTNQSAKSGPSPLRSNIKQRKGMASGQVRRINKHPEPVYHPEPVQNDAEDGRSLFDVNVLVMGIVILVFAVGVMWFLGLFTAPPSVVPDKQITTADIFLENFKQIKNSYPAQDARFWKIIGSQVKRVLSNDSMYPAVILLGIPEGHASLGTCVTKKVINAINNAVKMTGDSYINSVSLDQTSAAKAKLNLDENLKTVFAESKGAIIDHVEMLPAKAALLLHGYCDGDNAPYKDVVLFLVLHTELERNNLDDKVVENALTKLWGDELGVDEMPALCSRIANNIVVLSPEEDETLSSCK